MEWLVLFEEVDDVLMCPTGRKAISSNAMPHAQYYVLCGLSMEVIKYVENSLFCETRWESAE